MAPEAPQPRPPPPQRLLSNSSKRSLRSHSSSFEADDERSSSGDQESMGPEPEPVGHIRPQYAGEDTRLTSRKELAGWYAYAFAAEVFIICGMGELRNFPFNPVFSSSYTGC
jgi:MFS transporter, UMF1 family